MDGMAARQQGQRGGRAVLVVVAFVCLLAACQAVLGLFRGGPSGPLFPHARHLEEGLDCDACHTGAEDQAAAGFPATVQGCMLCHEELDRDKPRDRTVAAFVVAGKPRWLGRTDPYRREVRFDHAKHGESGLECGTCHEAEAKGSGPSLRIAGGKATCMACHAQTDRGNDCAVCHRSLRRDEPPPSHSGPWKVLHGKRAGVKIAGLGQTTCDQCHSERSCTECHREQPPGSHTNFWRRRGHGLTAAIDRTSCTTCHEPDYCTRCHRQTRPASHRGAFGPPLNTHCATCHLPARGLGCGVCHDGFPGHEQGPQRPGNAAHLTSSSPAGCLACHLALKHPNPGGDCRVCHK